ncbi:DUF2306 domain-containing protein [Aureibacter tunicatorum]|uniref:Membrane protein n=1 Tax=Aureibacter tunicatorum TaxID=866807 RepID=A0AAE4BSA7_9BACT|nr:DUF2306 domain-containing protein [Aureibacter tunicatorum]MDR6238675.1 putative membrane protein [Aureibacter tunicatorum]BDD05394.1 hypothetical protein AUTU_28770 [Aureibacter tunicatorum]
MNWETLAKPLIMIHAFLGVLALISGSLAIVSNKGKKVHRKSGSMFFYTMLSSALLALAVSVIPGHESMFLFAIGLFSIYFLISGYRSLWFRSISHDFFFDKIMAYFIVAMGLAMVFVPFIFSGKVNVVLAAFGGIGFSFGMRDLKVFKRRALARRNWLKLHLGKMMGGYIAACTAFLVVNNILPNLWNWFAPTVVGSVFITYWMVVLNLRKAVKG